jgi:flagellar hook-length control protein FliK
LSTAAIMPGFTLPAAAPSTGTPSTALSVTFGDLLSAFTGSQGNGEQGQQPAAAIPALPAQGEAEATAPAPSTIPELPVTALQGQPALFTRAAADPAQGATAKEQNDLLPAAANTPVSVADPLAYPLAAVTVVTPVAVPERAEQKQPALMDQQPDHADQGPAAVLAAEGAPIRWTVPAESVRKNAIAGGDSTAPLTATVPTFPAQLVPYAPAGPAATSEPVPAPPVPVVGPEGSRIERIGAPVPLEAGVPRGPESSPATSQAAAPQAAPAPARVGPGITALAYQPVESDPQLQPQQALPAQAAPSGPAVTAVDWTAGATTPEKVDATETQQAVAFMPTVTDAPKLAAQSGPPVPAATLQQQPMMATQLAKPLFTLASEVPGEHIMTLKVSPEDLGPVTVRAHISAEGVRLELFAAGDAGRDAVRSALPELRRELAQQGLAATLDLSGRDNPGQGQQQTGQHRDSRGGQNDPYPANLRMVTEAETSPVPSVRAVNGSSALDVVA